MSWFNRLFHKSSSPLAEESVGFRDIVELTRASDVAGLVRLFSLGDWETRELVAAALGNICRDSKPDVDYDREEMVAALGAIIDLCESDGTGDSYRENCLDHARMLLKRPEFDQSQGVAEEAPSFFKVAKECNDPLIAAIKAADSAKVMQLLEAGADPNAQDGFDDPSLVIAAGNGQHLIVEQLIAHGADPNGSGDFGTALNRAAESGHEQIVQTLLKAGADVNGRDSRGGRTPVDSAEATGHFEIARLLYDAGGQPGMNRGEHLMSAAMAGSFERIAYYLQSGDVIDPGHLGEALVFLGLADFDHRSDCVKIANLLLSAGADVNYCTADGQTPLLVATATGNADLVQLLTERHVDSTGIAAPETLSADTIQVSLLQDGIADSISDSELKSAAVESPVLEFLDMIVARLRFDPTLCVHGVYVLKFPDGFDEAYGKHLSLVEHLKSNWIYPSLSVYGLRSVTSGASVARLILVTGDLRACEQLNDALYTPEAEQFVAAECAGNWDAINPASSVSNIGQAGMSVDFGGVVAEIERLAGEIRAGAYAIERTLDWDWRGQAGDGE